MATRRQSNDKHRQPKRGGMSTNFNGNGGSRMTDALFMEQLDDEIERRQRELDALIHARGVLRGVAERHHKDATTPNHKPVVMGSRPVAPTTVSEGVELLLASTRGHEMHLDQMVTELESRYSISVTRKNLANTLNRWLSRGKRFERVKANTYTLRS